MSCNSNTPNINKTFIIEPLSLTGGSPTLSACTSLYTNLIQSCSGDTTITMGTGVVTFNSNVNGINSFTANTIEANTYLSGGTNILDIVNGNDTFVTGGTFNDVSDTLTLVRNDGASVVIGGLANYYVTGGTYNNSTGLITFDRNDTLSAFTVDLSTIDVNDTFVTGGTLVNTDLILDLNDGSTTSPIDLSGLEFTGNTSATCISDIYVSNIHSCSPLYINPNNEGNIYFGSTSGVTIDVLSGGVVANTLGGDGTEIFNVPITGVTNLQVELDDKTDLTLFNSHTGDTNNPHSTSFSNLTSTAHTHSIGDVINLQTELDSKLDITTFNTYSGNVETELNTKISGATNLSSEGIFAQKNGLDLEFKGLTSTGGTVNISSNSNSVNLEVTTISSDKFVSGGTYNGGTKEINFVGNSVDTTFDVDLTSLVNSVTGDTFVTGFTWNPTTFDLTIEQNNGITDETVNLSVLATDVYVVSGVYNPSTGIVTYTNSTGGTFQVSGFTTGMTDSYTTAANLNGETIEFDNNIQGSNLYNVSLSPILSGKTDLTLFNSHTGDTNNPHQTSFSNLTATAHTHTISDVINLQTELDSKTNNIEFISHTGDTTIHFTKSSINLSDLGSSAHTHTLSEITDFNSYSGNVQTQIDNKTDLTLFNSHTGDTNNPHSTSFSNLTSTAHTHTLSDITDFNSYSGSVQTQIDSKLNISDFNTYSGNVQTQLDGKVEDGVNSGGSNEVFSGKSGTDLYFRTISGGSNTTVTTVGDIIKIDTTGGGGGGEANTASNVGVGIDFFKQKVGVDLEFRTLSGGTYTQLIQGTSTNLLNITGLTSNTDFISHTGDTTIHFTKGDINLSDLGSTAHTHSISEVINLQTELDNKTDLTLFNTHTGDTNNPHQTSFSNLTSTAHTHTLSEITDFNTYSGSVQTQLDTKIEDGINSGGANEVFSGKSGTDLYFRTISGGSNTTITTIDDIIKVDVSVPVDTNTFVTGGTYSSGTLTLDRNDGDTVTVTGFTTGGGDNFYVTGFTYNDANTFTISRNNGLSALTATINTLTGLTIDGVLSASTYTGITLTSLDDVTSNIPSTPDNTYQGRLLYFDAPSNQWLTGEEYVSAGNVTIWGKKGSAGTIDKGCPVYITGFDNDVHEVELANASTGSTMPVIGFTAEDFDNAGVYPLITFGKLSGIDTTSGSTILNPFAETWEVNDVLYMAKSDGGLTKFRPTGTNTQIQRIAKVLNVGTTNGQIFIFNTARTAGLPNLSTDYLWLGNGDDLPQEVIRTDVGITTTGFTYNDNNTFTITDDNGGSLSATINQVSGLTINGDLDVTGDTTLNTLTATSITSNSAIDVFNGHINLRDNSYFLQGRTVADGNVSLIGVDSQDRVFVGNAGYDTYIDSDTIVDGSLTATTLNITTIGTGALVNNLGVDANGNVVSGNTNTGIYGGDGTIPLNTTASVNGDLTFQGLDEDTRIILKDGNNGGEVHLFSDGSAGQSALEFYNPGGSTLTSKIQNAGGDTRFISNSRDLLFTTNTGVTTEGIFIQAGTGNMGIGTETPLVELHVKGDSSILRLETTSANNSNYIEFYDPSERKGWIGYPSSTSSTDALFIRNEEHGSKIIISTTDSGGTSRTAIDIDANQNVVLPFGDLDISGTLTIGALGTGTSVTNLGIDASGNVVSGTTGGSGEVNTASNLGGGTGLFAQKNGVDLEFKTLTSTGGTVTITNNSTTVNIESTGGGTGVSDANKIFSWFMNVT